MRKEWSIEIFVKNFKKYFELSGKNQNEIASAVGVSAPTVSDWMKGKKMPTMINVQKLADYFGVNLSDLLEENVNEEMVEKGDIAADITIRLGYDEGFKTVVLRNYSDKEYFELSKALCNLDSEQIKSLRSTITSFFK